MANENIADANRIARTKSEGEGRRRPNETTNIINLILRQTRQLCVGADETIPVSAKFIRGSLISGDDSKRSPRNAAFHNSALDKARHQSQTFRAQLVSAQRSRDASQQVTQWSDGN